MKRCFALTLGLTSLMWLAATGYALGPSRAPSGVWARFSNAAGQSATTPLGDARFFVEDGASPTALLPAGRFTAELVGFVRARLRSDFRFAVESSGVAALWINDSEVWSSADERSFTESIGLEKGNNALRVVFEAPESGPAYFRLSVSTDGEPFRPFTDRELRAPTSAHPWVDAIDADTSVLRGRALFIEGRCVQCHEAAGPLPQWYEAMDAPSMEGIGDRLNGAWVRAWLNDPKAMRATARMPSMLHGMDQAAGDAIAAFLMLQGDGEAFEPSAGDPLEGSESFLRLHCIACHTEPGFGPDPEGQKISLDHVAAKFQPGALKAFLMRPQAHYTWIRMPDFQLEPAEAEALASYLRAATEGVLEFGSAPEEALASTGSTLYSEMGCAACHNAERPRDSSVALSNVSAGCLSAEPLPGIPYYDWTEAQRADVRAFLERGSSTLSRAVPSEFADLQVEALQCAQCHGELDGVPNFNQMVGKLNADWTQRLLSGVLDYHPRPWLEQRMPAFPSRAQALAQGLAHRDGYGSSEPSPGRQDAALAEIGAQLVSPAGGFNCVQCHAVGTEAATEVFEAPGINFAYTHERLRRDFFHRWVENPQAIDPLSRMPAFFFDGRSPLTDVLGGDAQAQIAAMWEYLAAGRALEAPVVETTEPESLESSFE